MLKMEYSQMLKSQHPPRIRKAVKDFAKNLYSVKIRDIMKQNLFIYY